MKKALVAVALCVVAMTGLAGAQDSNLIPNRLAAAQVGEWASYALPGGYVQKLTVVKRFGEGEYALITVRVDNIYDGKVVNTREITEESGKAFTAPTIPNEPGITVAVRNDTGKLRGKDIPVGIVEINRFISSDHEDNTSTEWWASAEIPVFGILKKISNGDVEWELVQWGMADPIKVKKAELEAGKKLVEEATRQALEKAAK